MDVKEIIAGFFQTLDLWISVIKENDLDTLHTRPFEDSWSLGQVIVHVIEETQYFLEQVEAAAITKKNAEKEMHKDAVWMFANNSFPDTKLTSPSNSLHIRQPGNKTELIFSLNEIRKQINQIAQKYDLLNSIGKTKHPGLMYFRASEWLQFAEMHMRHHFHQKNRIEIELNKKKR